MSKIELRASGSIPENHNIIHLIILSIVHYYNLIVVESTGFDCIRSDNRTATSFITRTL